MNRVGYAHVTFTQGVCCGSVYMLQSKVKNMNNLISFLVGLLSVFHPHQIVQATSTVQVDSVVPIVQTAPIEEVATTTPVVKIEPVPKVVSVAQRPIVKVTPVAQVVTPVPPTPTVQATATVTETPTSDENVDHFTDSNGNPINVPIVNYSQVEADKIAQEQAQAQQQVEEGTQDAVTALLQKIADAKQQYYNDAVYYLSLPAQDANTKMEADQKIVAGNLIIDNVNLQIQAYQQANGLFVTNPISHLTTPTSTSKVTCTVADFKSVTCN